MSEPLKSCPFCGSTDVYFLSAEVYGYSGAGCNDCGISTEYYSTDDIARNVWNRRTPEPTPIPEPSP